MNDEFDRADEHGRPEPAAIRLRCGSIFQKVTDDTFEVSVTLEHDGCEYIGFAATKNTDEQRRVCIATATLSAVHAFLGLEKAPFRLMSVKKITSTPVPICMVLMEFVDGNNSVVLVGAAELFGEEMVSVQRASMDAINRKIAGLYAEARGL